MKKILSLVLIVACALFAQAETSASAPDLTQLEAAKAYVGAYADKVQSDPEFKAHEAQALATIRTENRFFGTGWALLPPLLAILLALITKEVYSSLFVGILAG